MVLEKRGLGEKDVIESLNNGFIFEMLRRGKAQVGRGGHEL
jgi:hypothetical protein